MYFKSLRLTKPAPQLLSELLNRLELQGLGLRLPCPCELLGVPTDQRFRGWAKPKPRVRPKGVGINHPRLVQVWKSGANAVWSLRIRVARGEERREGAKAQKRFIAGYGLKSGCGMSKCSVPRSVPSYFTRRTVATRCGVRFLITRVVSSTQYSPPESQNQVDSCDVVAAMQWQPF